MNDLTAGGVLATSSVNDTSTLYRKGVMPTGFRFGMDIQANSEHGGNCMVHDPVKVQQGDWLSPFRHW